MTKETTKFRFAYRANRCYRCWVLRTLDESVTVEFDQALVDLVPQRSGELEGYVLSIHGLDAEVAKDLSPDFLKALGVLHFARIPAPVRGTNRMRLMPDGRLEQA